MTERMDGGKIEECKGCGGGAFNIRTGREGGRVVEEQEEALVKDSRGSKNRKINGEERRFCK